MSLLEDDDLVGQQIVWVIERFFGITRKHNLDPERQQDNFTLKNKLDKVQISPETTIYLHELENSTFERHFKGGGSKEAIFCTESMYKT
jgi:hypothetical protein